MSTCLVFAAEKATAPPADMTKTLADLQQSFASAKEAEETMKTKALESQAATIKFQQAQAALNEMAITAQVSCKAAGGTLASRNYVWYCDKPEKPEPKK